MLAVAIAILLQLAALVVAARPGVTASRRFLAATLVVLLPVAGLVLAMMVRRSRGGFVVSEPDARARKSRSPSAEDVLRLAELPSTLDRLMSPDSGERLAALVCLSGSADANAVAVLRWTLEHGSPEAVLDAALTLEELDLRREAQLEAASRAYGARPSYETALDLGDAAAAGLKNGLADPMATPALAEQARSGYLAALEADPRARRTIEERLAQLELAAGRPSEALEYLGRLVDDAELESALELELLRDAAAFAARRFDQMSLAPEDLGFMPADEHQVFTKLDQALERAAESQRRLRVQPRSPERAAPTVRYATRAVSVGGTGAVSTGMFRLDPA
jgi:hypothetical protein